MDNIICFIFSRVIEIYKRKNRCQIMFCRLIECLGMKTAEKGDGLIVTPSWCVLGN